MAMLNSAISYVQEVGKLIVDRMKMPLRINEKINHSDLVTEVDLYSESFLRERIKRDYPDHWILSEEANTDTDAYSIMKQPPEGYGWIIDPIDGTTNFIHGIPHFAISIGMVNNGIPICGVVYNPMTEDLYFAQSEGGAFLNSQPIQVGPAKEMSEALLATGFQATDWKPDSVVLEQIGKIAGIARNVRIIGSASLDLCLVASGQLTGFWHDGLYPWDVAAGLIIIQEAGGKVTNREGKPFCLSDNTLVASNSFIHPALLSILK